MFSYPVLWHNLLNLGALPCVGHSNSLAEELQASARTEFATTVTEKDNSEFYI
jgi:hypothetical protein